MIKDSVSVRSGKELDLMRKSGFITASALKKVLGIAQKGVALLDLDKVAEEEIQRLGGQSSFKTVPGYFWTTCLTINDEVVHGIPNHTRLKAGDILSVDLGAIYQGWHTDAAWSVLIGKEELKSEERENKLRFLQAGVQALQSAISRAVEGNKIGDISSSLQTEIESAGFSVVKSLTGHGVGRSPHEPPEIPGFGKKGTGLPLKTGMTLAIEAIYAQGSGEVYEKVDGWTIASKDSSLGGLFEKTVIIDSSKAEVITDWSHSVAL